MSDRATLASPAVVAAAFAVLGLLVIAGTAIAAPREAAGRATLFLSPAGEPFHADPGKPYPVGAWFAQADANHDGKLTKDEFRADFARFFKIVDQNHDGVIDGLELQRYEQQIAPEVLPRLAQVQGGFPGERGGGPTGEKRLAEPPRKRGGPDYDGAPAYSLLNVSEPVASADGDFDGKITLEEFQRTADRRFDQLDKDRNGYLTLDTLPQTPEQITVEGKKRR
ncbi:MAG TPA: EF-hand domain-containing protein [Caulobacteraceae bacterium]